MKESALEAKCNKYAAIRGWIAVKISAVKGFPDRIYLKQGLIFFVEFKKDAKSKPSIMQTHYIKLLQEAQFNAYVIKSENEFIKVIDELN